MPKSKKITAPILHTTNAAAIPKTHSKVKNTDKNTLENKSIKNDNQITPTQHKTTDDTILPVKKSGIEILPEYHFVKNLVDRSFPLIFVTGGAGTGKSTFIKWLVKTFDGEVLLAAPTAMAALNIEGKTLHSLCQLPPAWIIKKDIKHAPHRKEIKNAKLLIIDEISMVTANLLDGVSAFFRQNRGIDQAFGGLTVIMVGDLFQLPPIVSNDLAPLFEHHYGSAKFYHAKSLKNLAYYPIELKKTFRQENQDFVDMLTNIREGLDVEATLSILNSQCTITNNPPEGAVWLSPRNSEVDKRNLDELNKMEKKPQSYYGEMAGKFSARPPSPQELVLKKGAQVMFTKNDTLNFLWINGTVGTVESMSDHNIVVKLAGSGKKVDVGRTIWQELQYRWTEVGDEIERDEIGSYTQFPLVLAWAMTIHKSQGRSIDKVHLALGKGAFETGQTYVALSRCRSLEGLSLSRPLTPADIMVDQEAVDFYQHLRALTQKIPPEKLLEKLDTPNPLNNEATTNTDTNTSINTTMNMVVN